MRIKKSIAAIAALGCFCLSGCTEVSEKIPAPSTTTAVILEEKAAYITLDRTELSIDKGYSEKLTAEFNFSETIEDMTITWSSSDETIATVNEEGLVEALEVGEVTISATAANGEMATCTVTISEPGSEDPSAENEEAITEDTSVDEDVTNTLMPIVDAALAVGEWPAMMEVTDTAIISDFMSIDKSAFPDSVFMQCPMSANMSEIIIIKAENIDDAKNALLARQEKARSIDAFYPDDVEKAETSIVGTEGNYAYWIMCSNSTDVESAIIDYIKTLGSVPTNS